MNTFNYNTVLLVEKLAILLAFVCIIIILSAVKLVVASGGNSLFPVGGTKLVKVGPNSTEISATAWP